MSYDVIVIGGGPAGATTAALTAEKGHSTLLLERDPQPRFKIGESLMPGTYGTFKKLGVLDQLKQSCFQRKYSVQFISRDGRASSPFYFRENDDHERSDTWQVLRSEFDQMMLDNASRKGAEVKRGVKVLDVLFEGKRAVGVEAKMADGEIREIAARVVVDASGQSAFLSRKLGIRSYDPELKKAAVYAHFENAYRDDGRDEGATLVVHTEEEDSWFWYIPLHENVVSVGVVGDLDYLIKSRDNDMEAVFQEELDRCDFVKERLKDAKQLFPAQATKEFSYRSQQMAGDGWVLVGDAYGFLDPIYSSGVFLALKSGECAADAIHRALESGDLSGQRLGDFGDEFKRAMDAVKKLVFAFYTKDFSFAKFLREYPHNRQPLVDLLVGNIYGKDFSNFFRDLSTMCPLPETAPEERQAAPSAQVS
ncbi:MAG TPA: NAD(P)/FAD-dependent oxidoreductase [Acidobacteriota bacterium]|nr:NAD(P)/FAD-dependent oxidoreductase [Acidobacteriota bacterium]